MADMPSTIAFHSEMREDQILVIYLKGELYSKDVPDFTDLMRKSLRQTQKIILDISELVYICSAGMGSLLANYNQVRGMGGRLLIAGIPPEIQKLFEFVGFDKFITQVKTIEEGIQFFQENY